MWKLGRSQLACNYGLAQGHQDPTPLAALPPGVADQQFDDRIASARALLRRKRAVQKTKSAEARQATGKPSLIPVASLPRPITNQPNGHEGGDPEEATDRVRSNWWMQDVVGVVQLGNGRFVVSGRGAGGQGIVLLRETEHGWFPLDLVQLDDPRAGLCVFGSGRFVSTATRRGHTILGIKDDQLKVLHKFPKAPSGADVIGDQIYYGRGTQTVQAVNLDAAYDAWTPKNVFDAWLMKQARAVKRGKLGFEPCASPFRASESQRLFGADDDARVHPSGRVVAFPRRDAGRGITFVHEGQRIDAILPAPLPDSGSTWKQTALWISSDGQALLYTFNGKIVRIQMPNPVAKVLLDLKVNLRAPALHSLALLDESRCFVQRDGGTPVLELPGGKWLGNLFLDDGLTPTSIAVSPNGQQVLATTSRDRDGPQAAVRLFSLRPDLHSEPGSRNGEPIDTVSLCGPGAELYWTDSAPVAVTAFGTFALRNIAS